MSAERNVQTVKDAYAAFGRGDVASILAMLADDVAWHGVKGAEGVVPQAGERHGKSAVAQFFQQVGETLQFNRFEPREYIATDDTVVAIGFYAGTARPTGRPLSGDFAMVFEFRNGMIARFREFCDSAALVRAFETVPV